LSFNTRQANWYQKASDWCSRLKEMYGEGFNLLKEFTQEFATNQDNALDVAELNTVVDADSSAAQAVLNVAATGSARVGDKVIIDEGGDREEVLTIESIGDGTITFTTDLAFTHTAVQGDSVRVMGPLYVRGITYSDISTAMNQGVTNFIDFWVGNAVATREYGKDIRRIADNSID
jgi:hypothetical protein